MNGEPICALHRALGRIEACPGAACPFWETGGAVISPSCTFERLGLVEFETRPGVARWLLGIRESLEEARTADERALAHRRLDAVLPPGLRD